MATKTVINTNMPQTRGISIIIDQDQSQQQQLPQQQQVVNCKQQLEAGKITIYQNTTTTTTTRSPAIVSTLQQQAPQMLLKLPATSTTFIDINRNSDKHNDHSDDNDKRGEFHHGHNHNDNNGDDEQRIAKETGYTTSPTSSSSSTTSTKTRVVQTSTTTFPQLLLRVAGTSSTSSSSGEPDSTLPTTSERGKLADDEAKEDLFARKAQTTQTKTQRDSFGIQNGEIGSVSSVGGVSITHAPHYEGNNGIKNGHHHHHHDAAATMTSKKMVIQCNEDHNVGEDHNEDDHHQVKHNEESCRVSLCSGIGKADDGENAGQHSLDSVSVNSSSSSSSSSLDGQTQRQPLENVSATQSPNRPTTLADCASALTETVRGAEKDSHVVKIQIKPSVEKEKLETADCENSPKSEKQVSIVNLNDSVAKAHEDSGEREVAEELSARVLANKTELHLKIEKMVQKPKTASTVNSGPKGQNNNSVNNNNNNNHNISSGSTTVTELNVSNPTYLYYMMSSGQFSPCDTLDSGTGSDLESNGNNGCTPSPKVMTTNGGGITSGSSNGGGGAPPKLELHLKTTKIRVNNPSKSLDKQNRNNADHLRAGSLTDSEESESSSLSCDSLHSSEFMRQSSVSPTHKTPPTPPKGGLGAFLPDSLLRDIRDRKFPTNDFEAKYGGDSCAHHSLESVHEQDYVEVQQAVVEHAKFLQDRNTTNAIAIGKRASLPNKTFVLNTADGTFVDTKMNSMPRKYEADKYYNFHVNEHENFRSFGNGGSVGVGGGSSPDDTLSLSEFETKSLHEDAFAGYKDIRCGSATSTIRSSKGTVRGVKNRVRNGIATFLQLQHPNVKNFKEKDLGKVVLYTTSMGIIRDTYAKCSNLKQILRTLLVKFEERDVFMSVEYQQEIKERMHLEAIKVPQLYVEGQHIGDAETVERLNESGELRQLLKPYKSIATMYTCQTCGGYRLLPCPSCNGSKKSVHRNHFTAEFVALKCMNCDEVGLVKCHNC